MCERVACVALDGTRIQYSGQCDREVALAVLHGFTFSFFACVTVVYSKRAGDLFLLAKLRAYGGYTGRCVVGRGRG